MELVEKGAQYAGYVSQHLLMVDLLMVLVATF